MSVSLGMFRTNVYAEKFNHSPLREHVGTNVSLQGFVTEEPDLRASSQHLTVRIGNDKLLVTTNMFSAVSYGDEVTIEGKLALPKEFETDTGRVFDYPHYLLAKEIEYTISYAKVSVLSTGNGSQIISALLTLKQSLKNGIESVIREPYAGLGEGLLLGVKQALGKDIEADFRAAGIIHIVVLSGYNIMLIVVFSLAVLARFCTRRVRILVGMGLVISFALMVGLSATVVRASLMALLFLTAELLRRTYDISRSLLLAAALMVFVSPYILLYDIGFQLSFMATLGLIIITPKLESFTSVNFGTKEYIVSTVATQIAVLPLLLYYMGAVSVVAVLANLLVLPVVPLAMLTTALAGGVAIFSSFMATPFAFVAELLLSYIITIAAYAARVPFATVSVAEFPTFAVIASYLFLGGVLWWLQYRNVSSSTLLSGWMIEEEDEQKAGEALRASPAPETPIFFR